jgi:hypothetical protein
LVWVRTQIKRPGLNRPALQPPLMTIFVGEGNVRNASLAYAALCHAVGLEVVLEDIEGHTAVGVAGKFSGAFYNSYRNNYYYAETGAQTAEQTPRGNIGDCPKPYQERPLMSYLMPQDRTISVSDPQGVQHVFHLSSEEFLRWRERQTSRCCNARNPKAQFAEFVTYRHPVITELARVLTQGLDTPEAQAQALLDWVAEYVKYTPDYCKVGDHRAAGDYFRYPVETLFEACGDCEDSSFLYAALCKAAGLEVALVLYPDHVVPAVSGDFQGICYEVGGGRFFPAATTLGKKSPIGASDPKHLKGRVFVMDD